MLTLKMFVHTAVAVDYIKVKNIFFGFWAGNRCGEVANNDGCV